MKFIKKLLRMYVKRPLAAIKFSAPVWRFFNRVPRSLYAEHPVELDAVQQRVARELREEGISVTSMDELFQGDLSIFDQIMTDLDRLRPHAVQDPKKDQFKILWDSRRFVFDMASGFTQFVLSNRVVRTVNAYMGMWSRVCLSNGYVSEPNPNRPQRIKTQKWHRDRHDRQLVSVFVYLTDVDCVEDGAFWFVKKSHVFGKYARLSPQAKPFSLKKFPDEDVIERSVDAEDIVPYLGKKGTIIFADATGIHRGGHSTKNTRILFLTAFTSDTRFSKASRLGYPDDVSSMRAALKDECLYAAGLEKK